ncbi:MAG: hypothetical protein WC449_05745 [Candidatus Paceibacterota bacterium]
MRRPPYANIINPTPTLFIFSGTKSWNKYKNAQSQVRAWSILLPPGDDPKTFDWSVCRDRIVIVKHDPEFDINQRKALALCVLKAGAKEISFVNDAIYSLSDKDFFGSGGELYVEDYTR